MLAYQNKKLMLIALIMAILLLLSACSPAPLRLHIMANSNTEDDQAIKLTVRNAVLDITREGMAQCENAQQARAYLTDNLEIIEKTANKALSDGGFEYKAQAQIGVYHFPEKCYQEKVYPEGDYQALRITLGEGMGENWWCVMFPPLCVTEIEMLDEQEVAYTSFLAELFKSLFG